MALENTHFKFITGNSNVKVEKSMINILKNTDLAKSTNAEEANELFRSGDDIPYQQFLSEIFKKIMSFNSLAVKNVIDSILTNQ